MTNDVSKDVARLAPLVDKEGGVTVPDTGGAVAAPLHDWFLWQPRGWTCCRNCGVIQNEGNVTKLCRGRVRVLPR